jgi:hypothetical protein
METMLAQNVLQILWVALSGNPGRQTIAESDNTRACFFLRRLFGWNCRLVVHIGLAGLPLLTAAY